MSLNFAGIVPHSPLLIPSIGKDKLSSLSQTIAALKQMEQDIYLAKPDIIVIISPHGSLFDDAFTVNAHTSYISGFDQFGDFETKRTWKGSPDLAAKISHSSHEKNIPVRLVSNDILDHGASVPLYYLTEHNPTVKILPIGFSKTSREDHAAFGQLLKEIIMEEDKRIAVIASGDLSHRLTPDSPDGFHKDGEIFNTELISLLTSSQTDAIRGMDTNLVENASACMYRSLLILLGVLSEMDSTFTQYSYESPFGVGYLSGIFSL